MATAIPPSQPSPLGQLKADAGACPLPGGKWYTASATGDGLSFDVPPGALAPTGWLSADLLLDSDRLAVFSLSLYEAGPAGAPGRNKAADAPARVFRFSFSLLPQCSARLRLPLEATNQNRWAFHREGACLKMMAGGDRVDPAKVVRATLSVSRKGDGPVRFAVTALTAAPEAPKPITQPVLPKGNLLDAMGQAAYRDWPARTKTPEECTARLKAQLADAPKQAWPAHFSKWGGNTASRLRTEKSGYFTTTFDGSRWWILDPDGFPFWSAGMDCVRSNLDTAAGLLESALAWVPEKRGEYADAWLGRGWSPTLNYLGANFIRAFGKADWHRNWATISLSLLRAWGFNTVANWSEDQIAREAAFPYVRPLSWRPKHAPNVFRDFPDVFSPAFATDAADYAKQLTPTRADPALIGYFLMNEPTWGFASETPAAGMLYTHETSHCRDQFARFLAEKYTTDANLARAWGIPDLKLSKVASGKWELARRLPPRTSAREDCAAFSTRMVGKLFTTLSAECKKVDPNHMNLGARYHTVPPPWALAGMNSFDVFSINCYQDRVPAQQLKHITDTSGRPVLIGEYHFGALDAGLPASGIGHVATQADRGKAFRVYTETAAALPQCVGVHYFTMYDQSALGRFDGECYQIGFLDTCNRPYPELCAAARASHERIYDVAAGKAPPYTDAPKYLPKLF